MDKVTAVVKAGGIGLDGKKMVSRGTKQRNEIGYIHLKTRNHVYVSECLLEAAKSHDWLASCMQRYIGFKSNRDGVVVARTVCVCVCDRECVCVRKRECDVI